jgi:hypothetical protein
MVAHHGLLVRCWRALLWRMECGTIWAGLLVCAPPVAKLCALTAGCLEPTAARNALGETGSGSPDCSLRISSGIASIPIFGVGSGCSRGAGTC